VTAFVAGGVAGAVAGGLAAASLPKAASDCIARRRRRGRGAGQLVEHALARAVEVAGARSRMSIGFSP